MRILFFIFSLFCLSANASQVEASPKHFEWGAGVLSIYGNHYRGSDQGKLWTFPLPYFSYISEHIEAEPSFIRGIFVRNEWFSFKLSLMVGLNAESEENMARAGMPSLDYTFEAGPMFIFHLWKSEDENVLVNFEWPIREIFATDLSYVKHVGLYTVPYFNIKHLPTPTTWNWNSELSVSPMFADQKYHHYFYGVNQEYASPERPYYKAHGGYSGFQTALVLNKHFDNFVMIPFIRWDYLNGARFIDSPLVKTKNYFIGGLGLFWLFK